MHSTRGDHRLGIFESLISVGTPAAIRVEGELGGGKQIGTSCWLTRTLSANRSLNTIPQKGSGDIVSRAKTNSHGAPYGLSLQLDIIS